MKQGTARHTSTSHMAERLRVVACNLPWAEVWRCAYSSDCLCIQLWVTRSVNQSRFFG